MKLILSILLTVLTTYHHGVYESSGEIELQCSQAEANAVIDSLMADFEHNPEHLFEWAFYGTGEQRDDSRKQGFVIHYDTVRYDAPNSLLSVDMTMFTPRGKADHLHVEPTLSDSRRVNGVLPSGHGGVGYQTERTLFFGVNNFSNVIKYCDATVVLIPSEGNDVHAVGTQRITLQTHCKFGWFFNLFISRKMYRNTVEWRMQQFLENLRNTAEKKPLQSIKIDLE